MQLHWHTVQSRLQMMIPYIITYHKMLLGIFRYLFTACIHPNIYIPGFREYAFGYIKAFPCPFRMQHLIPSSLSIEKSLLATAFTFIFCLRICCALPIQVISSSLPIGFCFNSSGYSFPNRSIPSKQSPSRACLEAKEYSSYQQSSCSYSPYIQGNTSEKRKLQLYHSFNY